MASIGFPLAAEQRSMLYLDRTFGPGIQHNTVAYVPVPPGVPAEAVAAALAGLGRLHPGLHAQICGEHGDRQRIGTAPIPLERHPAGEAFDAEANRMRLQDRRLDRTGAARACALLDPPVGGRPGQLLIAYDHLICDTGAYEVLMRDLPPLLAAAGASRAAGGSGASSRRSEAGTSALEEYCSAQARALRTSHVRERECANWSRTLDGCVPQPAPADRDFAGTRWPSQEWWGEWFTQAPHRTLTRITQEFRTTAFVGVAAALALSLWRRSTLPAGALVTPISTRYAPDVADLVSNMVNERPVAYRIDPDESFAALVRQINRTRLCALRDSRLAIPDVAERVPAFRAFFGAPGSEYVQLQVLAEPAGTAAIGHGTTTERGPYSPGVDVTCTTIRVFVAPDVTRVRVFYGGPAGGRGRAREVAEDMVSLLCGLPDGFESGVGDLTDRVCVS
jgi:hypothetical protein